MEQDAAQARSRREDIARQAVHLDIAVVADHQMGIRIEHAEALRHVVKRDLEQLVAVAALALVFGRDELGGALGRLELPPGLCMGAFDPAFLRQRGRQLQRAAMIGRDRFDAIRRHAVRGAVARLDDDAERVIGLEEQRNGARTVRQQPGFADDDRLDRALGRAGGPQDVCRGPGPAESHEVDAGGDLSDRAAFAVGAAKQNSQRESAHWILPNASPLPRFEAT